MTTTVTVIGGGLGGLIAAIEAADRGFDVTVFESHPKLGGRARTTASPYIAHEGPHVIYSDGPTWAWLRSKALLGDSAPVPPAALTRFRFRYERRLRRVPPIPLVRAILSRTPAPVDRSFRDWATTRWDAGTAAVAASAAGVVLFHHDPGELSAAFVFERLQRVFSVPPRAAYLRGGWSTLVERLAAAARNRGVRIETGHRINELPATPTIIATSLNSGRKLLADGKLQWPSGETSLIDVAVRSSRRDAFVVSDLDESGWLERFSAADRSLAPAGCSLIQAQVPMRPGESTDVSRARVERLLDLALPEWRGRVVWRRDAVARGRSGALDHPGTTWRDRPAIDRGNDVYLVGDQVAAPGLLSEVTFNSAMSAVETLSRRVSQRTYGAR